MATALGAAIFALPALAARPADPNSLDEVIKSFPPDTRPQGFMFDDSGAGRVVAGDLGDAYVKAALALAQSADLSRFGDAKRPLCRTRRWFAGARLYGRSSFRH